MKEFWVPESMIFNNASDALTKGCGAAVLLRDDQDLRKLISNTERVDQEVYSYLTAFLLREFYKIKK